MKNIHAILWILVVSFSLFEIPLVHAGKGKSSSTKVIDFESEVVEGMNKKPLDSLSHVSDQDKNRKRPHLYKKRVGFRTETKETLRNMRYSQ